MNFLSPFKRLFTSTKLISPGTYHYQSPADDPRNYRLHLRMESDGSGILILNASTIMHLNQTAAEYAYYLIQNYPTEKVGKLVASRYNVKSEQARGDYLYLSERIQSLINSPDLDPVTFLDFERQKPLSGQISAPYRIDCAVTYRLPETDQPDAAPIERVKRELSTSEWQAIFDKAWAAGIPHIILTGGEPTLREDLPELIAQAEKNGQVTGLLTDGHRLGDKAYLNKLLETGLDHLTIIYKPENPATSHAIENALAEDIFVAVHLTISDANQDQLIATIDQLTNQGVKAISLSTSDPAFSEVVRSARDHIADLNLDLIWNLPVPYSHMNPVSLEIGQEAELEGAGRAWLYLEPDGDVLPAQGINKVMGNLLSDSWEEIWRKTR